MFMLSRSRLTMVSSLTGKDVQNVMHKLAAIMVKVGQIASRRGPLLHWCKSIPSPLFSGGKPTNLPLGEIGRQTSRQVVRRMLARNQESLTCVTTHRHIGFLHGISSKVLFHWSNVKCKGRKREKGAGGGRRGEGEKA